MKDDFLTREVAAITGLKAKDVVDACDRGVIQPKVPPQGSGSRRVFSFRNVMEFGIFRVLKSWGYDRPSIKKIFSEIEESGEADRLYSTEVGEESLFLSMVEYEEGIVLGLTSVPPNRELRLSNTQRIRSSFLINLTLIKRRVVEYSS